MSRKFILHNNNDEKLLTKWKKSLMNKVAFLFSYWMNLIILLPHWANCVFLNTFEFFQNFLTLLKKDLKKIKAITVKLLAESPEKFLSVFKIFLKTHKFLKIKKNLT